MQRDRLCLFDSHLHVIDPRFPLTPNQGYLPSPFSADDYRRRTAGLGIAGGAVVSGSFQAFDQSYLRAALQALGSGFVGVTQLPPEVADQEILSLAGAGVRALRFNLRRGGSATMAQLDRMARRVHELAGWHVELYIDSRDLPPLYPILRALPALSIDHLGLSLEGLPTLLALVESGARVKASGFGRLDFDPRPVLRRIAAANPDALMFGTDLPSTRAPRPFEPDDVALLQDALAPELAAKALGGNARAFYRPAPAS